MPTRITRSASTKNNKVANVNVPSSLKGEWKTTRHGIKRKYSPTHPQNYGCKVCGQLLPSRGELNEHYRSSHPPVLCPVCKKTFSCPNTRDRHLYSHNLNKQFICDTCEESFAFSSELASCKIIHRTIKTWMCARKGCGRDFKCKGDLAAHAKSHDGQVFMCMICNNFSSRLEKNLKSHQRCHTQELKIQVSDMW